MKTNSTLGLRLKLLIGFLAIITSIVIILVFIIINVEKIKDTRYELEKVSQINIDLVQTRSDLNRIRGLVLEIIIETNPDDRLALKNDVNDRIGATYERLKRIRPDLKHNPEALAILDNIEQEFNRYNDNRDTQYDLVFQGKIQEVINFTENVQSAIYNDIRNDIINLEDLIEVQAESLLEQSHKTLDNSTIMMVVIGILVIAVSLIIMFAMIRIFGRLSKDIRESVGVLGTSSSQIQTTVAEISTGAAETATAISETTTTVEEIRQTSMLANEKAKSLLDSAKRASDISDRGIESSQIIMDSMKRIDNQMKLINSTILKLSEQNRSIGEITTTVADIADQSNLLAVNAAIEAAKAGEHGRGFTVVAQEIRSLAEQSKKSTAQVKEILNEIQKSVQQTADVIRQGNTTVEEGVRLVNEDREIVDLLTETVREAMQASIQISSSSQQQMAGMDQIVPAMSNIKSASEQNVTGIRQTQDALRSLSEIGLNLQQIIDSYRL